MEMWLFKCKKKLTLTSSAQELHRNLSSEFDQVSLKMVENGARRRKGDDGDESTRKEKSGEEKPKKEREKPFQGSSLADPNIKPNSKGSNR